jgi:thiazolylpeptide-type bacteriocin precursor
MAPDRKSRPGTSTKEKAMEGKIEIESLAVEIAQLEFETFEIADYAEANELFLAGQNCSTCSSTTSTTSTCA